MTDGEAARTEHIDIPTRYVVIAIAASLGGLIVHNLADFPPSILLAPETIVPVVITVVLGLAMVRWSSSTVFFIAGTWAVIVIVVGGASVLPLSIWPFEPAQTLSHYGVHVVYAAAQLPLLWVAVRGYRIERARHQQVDDTTTRQGPDAKPR